GNTFHRFFSVGRRDTKPSRRRQTRRAREAEPDLPDWQGSDGGIKGAKAGGTAMGFHHLAIATKDAKATYGFYTAAMGFELVKVEVGRAGRRGWAKHLFYDTGNGEMIAFWDFHDAGLPDDWSPAISDGLGLPHWANHVAFHARDLEELAARRLRWL